MYSRTSSIWRATLLIAMIALTVGALIAHHANPVALADGFGWGGRQPDLGSMMVAAFLRIAPLASTAGIDPAVLRDLMWDCAAPDDAVEHLYIRAGPDGVDIIAFIDTTDARQADDALHRLVEKSIASKPQLRLWRVI
jgi:hypothetical protein